MTLSFETLLNKYSNNYFGQDVTYYTDHVNNNYMSAATTTQCYTLLLPCLQRSSPCPRCSPSAVFQEDHSPGEVSLCRMLPSETPGEKNTEYSRMTHNIM